MAYLLALALALLALWQLDIPYWVALAGLLLCLTHAGWVLPRAITLRHRRAYTGVRHGDNGWQVWSEQGGWQPMQVCADSLALPMMVVLRFRMLEAERPGWRVYSTCIPRDALAADDHRRLRVLLKFARR